VSTDQPTKSQDERFVDYIIKRCESDNGVAAALRRADNPSTQHQSWSVLAQFNVDLENATDRLTYALVASSIAHAKATLDGQYSLGTAIARSYPDSSASPQASARLRRLLACDDVQEVVTVLRPMLSLVRGRGVSVKHSQLLRDLRSFRFDPTATKAGWAADFYRTETKEKAE
jgi:CRISPR system Cascade subunit CasB